MASDMPPLRIEMMQHQPPESYLPRATRAVRNSVSHRGRRRTFRAVDGHYRKLDQNGIPEGLNFWFAQDYRPMLTVERRSTNTPRPISFRLKLHLGSSAAALRQFLSPCGFGLDFRRAWCEK